MAAASSEPSPKASDGDSASNQPNGQGPPAAGITQKSPPLVSSTSVTEASPSTNAKAPSPGSLPTYESSEASQHYLLAKSLLNDGDFETALTTIEDGIVQTKQNLLDGGLDDDAVLLHESMAPLHYLYGTTLLYSIEESQDENQQMTNANDEGENGEGDNNDAAGAVEEMEIAWENLDTARNILDRLVRERPASDKLKADLAQVHLREGDLLRQNGCYDAAVTEYNSCLQYRDGNSLVPYYSRKNADLHYNLGMVYFNQVATSVNNSTEEKQEQQEGSETKATLSLARSKGFHHYYECGKIFAGIIAELCGSNPVELVTTSEASIPNFKCSGEEDDGEIGEHPKIIGLKLQSLRKMAEKLPPPNDAAIQNEVGDVLALLEEIQETVDEADNSEKGVHEATAMKEQIAAAVAAQAGISEEEEQSGQTSAIGFGSAAASVATASAQSIMVIKKKHKRDNVDEYGVRVDAKLPPKDTSNKRTKSAE